MSWCEALAGAHGRMFRYCLAVAVLSLWGALCDERCHLSVTGLPTYCHQPASIVASGFKQTAFVLLERERLCCARKIIMRGWSVSQKGQEVLVTRMDVRYPHLCTSNKFKEAYSACTKTIMIPGDAQ